MMYSGMVYNAAQAVSEYQFFLLVNLWLMGEYLFDYVEVACATVITMQVTMQSGIRQVKLFPATN